MVLVDAAERFVFDAKLIYGYSNLELGISREGPSIEPCGTPFDNGASLCTAACPGIMKEREFHFHVQINYQISRVFKTYSRVFLSKGT